MGRRCVGARADEYGGSSSDDGAVCARGGCGEAVGAVRQLGHARAATSVVVARGCAASMGMRRHEAMVEFARWLEACVEGRQRAASALPTHPQHALWRRDFSAQRALRVRARGSLFASEGDEFRQRGPGRRASASAKRSPRSARAETLRGRLLWGGFREFVMRRSSMECAARNHGRAGVGACRGFEDGRLSTPRDGFAAMHRCR